MVNQAAAGAARERRISALLADHGWLQVARAAGSKGPADLVMAHWEHGVALVQVGSKAKVLGPADRQRLLAAAQMCSALPLLAVEIGRAVTYHVVSAEVPSKWERWTP